MPHGYRSTALSIYLFACGAAGVHRLAPATSVTFRNATIDRPISQPFVRNDLGPAWFFPSRTRCINYVLSFTCLSTQLLVLAIKWTIYFSGRWNSHRDMLVEFDPRGVAGIAVDASGSVYFADNYTNRTRKGLHGGNHHHDFRNGVPRIFPDVETGTRTPNSSRTASFWMQQAISTSLTRATTGPGESFRIVDKDLQELERQARACGREVVP